MLRFVTLQYDFSTILKTDHSSGLLSCLCRLKQEMPELYESSGGMPESFCESNTQIGQLWWTGQDLDFEDIGHQLGMTVLTVSSIEQKPGRVIPWHRDTFYKIRQQFPDHGKLPYRANIHMNDCDIGHFIQYEHDGEIHTYTGWKQGQGIAWDSSVSHLGANVGLVNKYTLQISGFQK